jgi:hypothetical protein
MEKRRQALAARIPRGAGAGLQGANWRFDIDRKSGAWALTDKATGVHWTSDPTRPRFGEVAMRAEGRSAVCYCRERQWHMNMAS